MKPSLSVSHVYLRLLNVHAGPCLTEHRPKYGEFFRIVVPDVPEIAGGAVTEEGMLANKQVINAVADALERHRPAFIVLDPVMVATSGARLPEPDALDARPLRDSETSKVSR